MSATGRRERIVVLMLLLAAAGGLAISRHAPIRVGDTPTFMLPARVDGYRSIEQRFCQNERCLATFDVHELLKTNRCPRCEGELDNITLAENRILPKDTVILKRIYESSIGQSMAVSVVISGSEQRSIHRPQQCLPAQGFTIEGSRVVTVDDIPGRAPLDVMVLDARTRYVDAGGRAREHHVAYAYWFIGDDRETPYHLQRLFWMGADRLLRGVAHRWAYVGISTRRTPDDNAYLQRLERFIAHLYPLMTAPE